MFISQSCLLGEVKEKRPCMELDLFVAGKGVDLSISGSMFAGQHSLFPCSYASTLNHEAALFSPLTFPFPSKTNNVDVTMIK